MIRLDGAGRYCLNDLHRASGGEVKNRPSTWLQNQQTRALIDELQSDKGASRNSVTPLATVNDGINNGTYVTELLVIAYAASISATVRVITRDGEPWFVAADVCAALDHSDTSKAVSRLDGDERGTNIVRTPSGDQAMLIISESGLYSLILTCRKPEAKRFKKWVTMNGLCSTLAARSMTPGACIQRTPLAASRCASSSHRGGAVKRCPLQSTSDFRQRCKGVAKRYPLQTAGDMQEVRVLSEPDELRLIMRSKLPAAEAFERWVFEDVLPAIRKTGSHSLIPSIRKARRVTCQSDRNIRAATINR